MSTDEEIEGTLELTVGVFANRMKRKLREQEIRIDESQKATEERHALILRAMTTIRKALQETCKIQIGSRFSFQLVVSDLEGWPKVDLNLVDSFAPKRVDYNLSVSANDSKGRGTIILSSKPGDVSCALHLKDPEEFGRIPLVLKKSVRQFLDIVANYVLNPKKPEELLEVASKAIESKNLDEVVDDKLLSEDLFQEEDPNRGDNIIEAEDEILPIDGLSLAK